MILYNMVPEKVRKIYIYRRSMQYFYVWFIVVKRKNILKNAGNGDIYMYYKKYLCVCGTHRFPPV